MTNIILLGKKSDKRISNLFCRALSQKCRIVDTQSSSVIPELKGADFVLWHSANLRQVKAKNAVLLFKNTTIPAPDLQFSPGTVAVVDSQNEAVVDAVAKSRMKALTCGLYAHDTLTLSSLTRDSAQISLQRTIEAFSGAAAEPFESPVRLTKERERYHILCICAVLLLSGRHELFEGLTL